MEKVDLVQKVKDLEWQLHLAEERYRNASIHIGVLNRDLLVRRSVGKVIQKKGDEYYNLQILEVCETPGGLHVVVT